ncbi:AraC family transcriptional regulator (plasmid) [Alteromonas sp. I4]|nr:AraC family transcriptional regulator [Alteromonas sp. I4]
MCYAQAVLRHVNRAGLNAEALLRKCGISPGAIHEPNTRLSGSKLADLEREVILAMKDEMLGYMPKPVTPGNWDILCHWLAHAESLEEVLERMTLYFRVHDHGFLVLPVGKGRYSSLKIEMRDKSFQPDPFVYELLIFSLHRLMCWLVNRFVKIIQTHLPFNYSPNSQEYKGLFLGSHVVMGASSAEIIFESMHLDLTVQRNQKDLQRFLRHPLRWMICETTNNSSWAEKVRQVMLAKIESPVTFEEIATELSVHPKKLSRVLTKENMSYTELKKELLRDLAIHLLQDPTLTVHDIASKVGFSETSAFSRAFKTWTAVSPQKYRRFYLN